MEVFTSYQLAKVRKQLLESEGYICKACGCEVHDEYGVGRNSRTKAQADHIVALANGGNNDISNFQILCRRCNLRKYKMDDEYFKKRIRAEQEYKREYSHRFNKVCRFCKDSVERLFGKEQKENQRRSYQKQKMRREAMKREKNENI